MGKIHDSNQIAVKCALGESKSTIENAAQIFTCVLYRDTDVSDYGQDEQAMARTVDEAEVGVIAFRAPAELLERVDATAAAEGISRSDVARRALMRDLERRVG
jgi:predicted DNA binding CopG/RHH family protein